ncbi:DNA repair protein RecO [Kangiella sp. TOML190]|uniref:DNA repair protein RecO n=1 Tax=Kangiella sp. TOML190 TaxID=2931351 RepID=UPI0020404D02|nr:DNA repair protein RecO [Kangiella sp. TOML190]
MSKDTLTPAFILHTRPFKETSLLVEAFTLEEGRVSLVAKGARSASNKNQKRALLQPFYPLSISWLGRANLKTLKQLDSCGLPFQLNGINNLCGLYLNELLLKLLIQWDPHLELFEVYQQTLELLQSSDSPQILLREFELYLLDELGYAIDWTADIHGDLIDEKQEYSYIPQQGFAIESLKRGLLIKGDLINAVAQRQWQHKGSVAIARTVNKHIIDHILDGKELNSRKLLQQTLALQA